MKLTVEGIPQLKQKLTEHVKKLGGQEDVIVGFTQSYAMHVHENLMAQHKEGKSAKYLLKAARMIWPLVPKIVSKIVQEGHTITKGLIVAGLRIQREAQLIVPIDTGALRASAYTAPVSQEVMASTLAFSKSETIKKNKLKQRAKAAEKKKVKAAAKKAKAKAKKKSKGKKRDSKGRYTS